MMKYEAPELKIILLQAADVLATTSDNPHIGKGENTDSGTESQFGQIPLW